MGKQTFHVVKRKPTALLLIFLAVSLTAASVSAWSSDEKATATSEKGIFAEQFNDTSYLVGTTSSTTTVTMPDKAITLTTTYNDSSTNNGFPYPRGTTPAYGMMGYESDNAYLTDNTTLIHFGWATSITPQMFVNNITKA